jgi:hypothetical protein
MKKSPGSCRGFFVLLRAFLKGVLGKVHFPDGVFVVRLWWIRGESWLIDDHFMVD